ncbi:hypothetical protein BJV82DRAFT_573726 [Fennellomyces sp. T-0311]|nr:hypothetical protein BJV82DRAFT_573726 [Fennellomyces sp. T-0311]
MENSDMTIDDSATSKYANMASAVDNFLSSIMTDAPRGNGASGASREVPPNIGIKRPRSPDDNSDGNNTKKKLNTGRSSGEFRKDKFNNNSRGRNDNHRHINDKRKRATDLEREPETRLIARRLRSRLQPSDLRHHFEKYGEVLEVALKNDGAYGFVQFPDAATCAAAVRGENGKRLNGCQLDLEVCRGVPFQRNQERRNRKDTRNDREDDRHRPRINDFYRPNRDDNDNPPRRRSSSEYSHSSGVHMSSALKKKDFPLPSRHGDSVPVVQVIAMGDADRPFISYVESAFRTRGMSIHTLFLQPGGLSRHAIVKQMIYEGVKAIVIIERGFEIQRSLSSEKFPMAKGGKGGPRMA